MAKPNVQVDRETLLDLLAFGLALRGSVRGEVTPTPGWRSSAEEILAGYEDANAVVPPA